MSTISDSLNEQVLALQKMGRRNYLAHYILSVVAILSSVLAGLSVALTWFGKDLLSVLSALPAAVLIISDRLNLEAKRRWYFEKSYALKTIWYGLEYEGLSVKEASGRAAEVESKFSTTWPGFVSHPR